MKILLLIICGLFTTSLMAMVSDPWLGEICNNTNKPVVFELEECEAVIQLNAQLDSLTMVKSRIIGESAEAGEILAYLDDNKAIKKITTTHFGETGKVSFAYYYKKGAIYIISREWTLYDRPIYIEGSSIESVEQTAYTITSDKVKGKITSKDYTKKVSADGVIVQNAITSVNKTLKQLPVCFKNHR